MLYLALAYCLLSGVCLVTGSLFYTMVEKEPASPANSPRPLVMYGITGLLVLTAIGQWLVLITPLTPLLSLCLLLILLLVAAWQRKKWWPALLQSWKQYRSTSPLAIPLMVALGGMVVLLNSGPMMLDDSESYHIQMVKWIQEYGTVPGLANLHLRYGFNSSWFTAIGLLSPRWEGVNTYVVLNGMLSFWCCQYLLEKMLPAGRPAAILNNNLFRVSILVIFVLSLTTFPMIRGNTATLNYDFITTLCILVLGVEVISSSALHPRMEWVLWPCFLFTIRFINFPILLLSFIALVAYWQAKKNHILGRSVAMGLLLIVPFLIRNVLLSGYIFFPIYQVDLFSVDWKVDRQMTINITEYIKYFNRINTSFLTLDETKALGWQWPKVWFHYLFNYDKPITVLGLLSYGICLLRWKTIRRQYGIFTILFLGVMLFRLITWFIIAPDPRFVYGPLLAGICMAFCAFPAVRMAAYWKIAIRGMVIFVTAACIAYVFIKPFLDPAYRNWQLPQPVRVPEVKTVNVDGITLRIPEKLPGVWNMRCCAVDLPCLYQVHPGLRLRGKNISDGFQLKNTPDSFTVEQNMYFWY